MSVNSVKQRVVRQSMIALAVYFVLTVSVVCAESVIPSFSLGAAFSESASYTREVRAGGLFVEKPYVPICLGFLYYSVLSFLISKLYGGNVLSLKEDAPEAILKK